MALPPLKTAISDTYPNPSNATARAGFAQLYDYVTSFPFGQCLLVKSGANLVLTRLNGPYLCINDRVQVIPSAGVSLAATGLTPNTLYFIYAFMSGATMTLEASTTVPATDLTTGVRIKTGDSSRTLVGQARPIAGPAWQDAPSQRFVSSWFNRRPIQALLPLSANISTSSGAYTEVDATFRLQFLSWAGDAISCGLSGQVANTLVSTVSSAVFANGTAFTGVTDALSVSTIAGANYSAPANCGTVIGGAADGYTYLGMQGSAGTAGTATWVGNAAPAFRCSLYATILG